MYASFATFLSGPRMRSRASSLCAVAFGLLLPVLGGTAVQAQDDHKPTNLKVLDSTMSREQVIGVMRSFTQSLGVGCDHCHAAPKQGQREPDFASDDNKIKLTARAMMQMTHQINANFLANLPATSDTPHVSVMCVTCHHGQPRPMLLQDVLKQARKAHGMAGVDSTYRELRSKYFGGFAYDFSDQVLAQYAMEIAPESNSDAMAVLNLNKEFNPKSPVTEWATGRLFIAKADTASAVAAFKRALEIDPNYRRAARELQTLGVK